MAAPKKLSPAQEETLRERAAEGSSVRALKAYALSEWGISVGRTLVHDTVRDAIQTRNTILRTEAKDTVSSEMVPQINALVQDMNRLHRVKDRMYQTLEDLQPESQEFFKVFGNVHRANQDHIGYFKQFADLLQLNKEEDSKPIENKQDSGAALKLLEKLRSKNLNGSSADPQLPAKANSQNRDNTDLTNNSDDLESDKITIN